MTTQDKSNLLMLCGALHDIAEIVNGTLMAAQIKDVECKIEQIVLRSMVEDLQEDINIVSEIINDLNYKSL